MALSLSGCASRGSIVTNARICAEIPFIDGAEGACVWSVTQKPELINAADWKKIRPKMLMIDVNSWTEIKKDWLKNCRYVGKECNIAVDSVDQVIRMLDKLSSLFEQELSAGNL